MALVNMYETSSQELAIGHIKGVWHDLGRQSHTLTVGLRRIEVAPEHFSTPAHEHLSEEEIFFVLSGDGLLWQDGQTFRVGAGDCIVHRAKRGPHTLRAGGDGLDVLAFGERHAPGLTALPRAGVAWAFPRWIELPAGENPFAREAAAGAPECPPPKDERPSNVIGLNDAESGFGGRARLLGRTAGARASGLNHVLFTAADEDWPAHCHSHEEEIFVVLEGDGVLELWERGALEPDRQPVRRGDVISRPAGTGVAHALRPGEGGLTYLAYGTRDTGDMCFYPQSGRVSLRGLGIALRAPEIEHLRAL